MPSLTDQQLTSYQQDGYVIVRQMFDSAEIDLLSRAAKTDPELDRRSYAQDDAEGGSVRLTLWNQPGDSLYGCLPVVAELLIRWNGSSEARSIITIRK